MSNQTINGKTLGLMLMGGASSLASHAGEINDLNVFPVADGDTGTNMSLTMEGGLSKISSLDTENAGEVSSSPRKVHFSAIAPVSSLSSLLAAESGSSPT